MRALLSHGKVACRLRVMRPRVRTSLIRWCARTPTSGCKHHYPPAARNLRILFSTASRRSNAGLYDSTSSVDCPLVTFTCYSPNKCESRITERYTHTLGHTHSGHSTGDPCLPSLHSLSHSPRASCAGTHLVLNRVRRVDSSGRGRGRQSSDGETIGTWALAGVRAAHAVHSRKAREYSPNVLR